MNSELTHADCQVIPEKEEVLPNATIHDTEETNTQVRLAPLKPARAIIVDSDNEDFLFLRSLLPYITALPLVQRLSLRSEINIAVIRAWEKRRVTEIQEPDMRIENKTKTMDSYRSLKDNNY